MLDSIQKLAEMQIVFKDCMKYRKTICKKNGRNHVAIPSTLTEAVNLTLCNKSDEDSYNNLKCLNRECNECGVDKFVLLPEEVSVNNDEQVVWKHYAYVGTGKFLSNGQEKKEDYFGFKTNPTKGTIYKISGTSKRLPLSLFHGKVAKRSNVQPH